MESLEKINYELKKMNGQKATIDGNKRFVKLITEQRELVEKNLHKNNENRFQNEVNPRIKDYLKTDPRHRQQWHD